MSSLAPGDAVRAQREPDLSFEPCVVKSVQADEAGAVACTLRFEDVAVPPERAGAGRERQPVPRPLRKVPRASPPGANEVQMHES